MSVRKRAGYQIITDRTRVRGGVHNLFISHADGNFLLLIQVELVVLRFPHAVFQRFQWLKQGVLRISLEDKKLHDIFCGIIVPILKVRALAFIIVVVMTAAGWGMKPVV